MKSKKENRGGARKGSGAKPRYNEKTEIVSFRCPKSKIAELKKLVKDKLVSYEKVNSKK